MYNPFCGYKNCPYKGKTVKKTDDQVVLSNGQHFHLKCHYSYHVDQFNKQATEMAAWDDDEKRPT